MISVLDHSPFKPNFNFFSNMIHHWEAGLDMSKNLWKCLYQVLRASTGPQAEFQLQVPATLAWELSLKPWEASLSAHTVGWSVWRLNVTLPREQLSARIDGIWCVWIPFCSILQNNNSEACVLSISWSSSLGLGSSCPWGLPTAQTLSTGDAPCLVHFPMPHHTLSPKGCYPRWGTSLWLSIDSEEKRALATPGRTRGRDSAICKL